MLCFVAPQKLSYHPRTWSFYPTASLASLDQICMGNHMDESAIWEKIAQQQELHKAKTSAI